MYVSDSYLHIFIYIVSVLSRLLLSSCQDSVARILFLAESLRPSHTPDLTGGSLPVVVVHLILGHHLTPGVATKPARNRRRRQREADVITRNTTMKYIFIFHIDSRK